MRISIFQKFLISLISVPIKILWLIDLASLYKPAFLRFSISAMAAFVIGFIIIPSNNSVIKNRFFDFTKGLNYEINGYIPIEPDAKVSLYLKELKRKQNLPTPKRAFDKPVVSASAALVIERNKDKILYELNKNKQLPPASTTKMMTAIIATELYKPTDVLTVPPECLTYTSQQIGLKPGDRLDAKDIIKGMLVVSGGDAACTLAASKTSEPEFVKKMNQKAMELKMVNTNFTNVIGLDAENSAHHSSAYDLYLLTQDFLKEADLKEYVKTKEDFIYSKVLQNPYPIKNTNLLLWTIPNSVGIKTGRTEAAKEVLVYEYKDDLRDLVIIVMGSDNRFADTENLLKWSLDSFNWE